MFFRGSLYGEIQADNAGVGAIRTVDVYVSSSTHLEKIL